MRRKPKTEDVVLQPGSYLIGGRTCRMQTVLGPGVVITLWNRARRAGAMAHFSVAARDPGIALTLGADSAWDGLQLVLQALQWSQVEAADCVARVCGGGRVMSRADRVPSLNTGYANGEFARRLLRACGVPIISEDFYAMGKHRITFNLNTGRVHARRIKPAVVAVQAPAQPRAGSHTPAASHRVQFYARAR